MAKTKTQIDKYKEQFKDANTSFYWGMELSAIVLDEEGLFDAADKVRIIAADMKKHQNLGECYEWPYPEIPSYPNRQPPKKIIG